MNFREKTELTKLNIAPGIHLDLSLQQVLLEVLEISTLNQAAKFFTLELLREQLYLTFLTLLAQKVQSTLLNFQSVLVVT